MKECCKTCQHQFPLTRFHYPEKGCEHTKMEGWACAAFTYEREMIWMTGLDEDVAHCEMWTKRREK